MQSLNAFHRRSPGQLLLLIGLCAVGGGVARVGRADQVLANFDGTGFNYTFSGFSQAVSPTGVRLYEVNDGWGGGGVTFSAKNLSSLATGRLTVDVERQPANQAGSFTLELFDTAGNTGKWTFATSQLVAGQPTQMVASSDLAHPSSGVGTLNLSQVNKLQVLGEFGSTQTFDLKFSEINASNIVGQGPYGGWELDAPWRAEAEQRIDAIRKANLTVTVVDAAGQPVPEASVHVAMQRHEFNFGTAVQTPRINSASAANATYRQNLQQWFTGATLENGHKWTAWAGDLGTQYAPAASTAATQWLTQHDYVVRGHNMVWPGIGHMPDFLEAKITEYNAAGTTPVRRTQLADEMRQDVLAHIQDIGSALQGQVTYWDVLNEPRVNHVLMDILGQDAMADWFNAARSADPDAKLFVNEYGILNTYGGVSNHANQQTLLNTVAAIKNAGAPVDGLGLQAHFSSGNLTALEDVWEILDRMDAAVDTVHITEFDVDTNGDEALQGAYFRDFLTAAFAHEAVDAFSVWGFWEDAVFEADRAMFRSDWSPKPNGQAWLDLVFDQWWTDETLDTDAEGQIALRGFRGDYVVTAEVNGATVEGELKLGADGASLELQLPNLLGDFNGDNQVDGADFLHWQRTSGDATGLAQWNAEFGSAAALAAASVVPEPEALVLAVLAAAHRAKPFNLSKLLKLVKIH